MRRSGSVKLAPMQEVYGNLVEDLSYNDLGEIDLDTDDFDLDNNDFGLGDNLFEDSQGNYLSKS